MLQEMTATLGRIVESRDPYTHGHQERVSMVARAIAEEMGLPERDAEAVEMAALVHDVGKLSVPAEILNRPGVLTEVEFGLIKTHSDRGTRFSAVWILRGRWQTSSCSTTSAKTGRAIRGA
jgi:HD-GYP domain-containing protein (c-di-GMP phosphodiesterase class II)